ncbi:MAG: hypothetical protein KZQ59_12350 [Candidatus Thiodiazotropha sp. (ex Lucinoma aequizonata)]|nr:hypothetical protein [Candidatus Thiodiazotropha sp. (ex Lucinoma aequizonata)]MCU7895092.1 hypothetical protein [Candidatus Thiodiazotropha sp. (ex Lucinoma aequizonata)]MCU7910708.1 hypothetical protein [Candidatus Thiodiazotropha sp. (ex Lucinoma aequizonata)]
MKRRYTLRKKASYIEMNNKGHGHGYGEANGEGTAQGETSGYGYGHGTEDKKGYGKGNERGCDHPYGGGFAGSYEDGSGCDK